jgi:hypothetical protein
MERNRAVASASVRLQALAASFWWRVSCRAMHASRDMTL